MSNQHYGFPEGNIIVLESIKISEICNLPSHQLPRQSFVKLVMCYTVITNQYSNTDRLVLKRFYPDGIDVTPSLKLTTVKTRTT